MAMRNAFRRPRRGTKPKYLWTSAVLLNQTVLSTVTSTEIVRPDDWERGATSFERATLVAIRGWFCVFPIATTTETWFAYIGLYDEDEASSLADLVATYDTEDILATYGGSQFSNGSIQERFNMQVNVKANRKITSATHIRMVTTGNAGGVYQMSGVLRGLVKYT